MPSGGRSPLIRSIRFTPSVPSRLDTLHVLVDAVDPDGDPVRLSYDWFVDGRELFGNPGDTLELADYPRGTRIAVRISASDGINESVSMSDEVEVANATPRFVTRPEKVRRIDGFKVVAEDPDGDELKWAVDGGPPALTIDAKGVLHWKGSTEDKGGHFDVKVTASDDAGGTATMELPLDVLPGTPGRGEAEKGAETAPSTP